jgi:hypothetical protein
LSGVDIEHVNVDGEAVPVVDFHNAMKMFAHFERIGSTFAKSVMEWCTKTLFSVQYNVGAPRKMAAHVRTVAGRSCVNPMVECCQKMLYMEIMGSVATFEDTWPELLPHVPQGGDAGDYVVFKLGEGSGNRFGENARALMAVYPLAEPECYSYRPTMLNKQQRHVVEKAFANAYSKNNVRPAPDALRRFVGDTEIFVLHHDSVMRAWKFVERETADLEEDIRVSITDAEHGRKLSELQNRIDRQTENTAMQAEISTLKVIVASKETRSRRKKQIMSSSRPNTIVCCWQ